MKDETMIPMEDALASGFENSTREELVRYCDLMGIDSYDASGPIQSLKDTLNAALGFGPSTGPARREAGKPPPQSAVICPYNLTPHGKWGGRRRRIELPRPDGNTVARAESFGWNGKATYWLPYDELVSVPYPIYMILVDTKKPRMKQLRTQAGDGSTEITTGWDHVSRAFRDNGDDPITANLPCSLTEWYQDKGQKFYNDLGPRDLRTVAMRLDIPTQGDDRKARPHEDILGDVLVFLFGYAESDSALEAAA